MFLFRVKFTDDALDYISEKNEDLKDPSEQEKYVVAFFYYSATT
ncbi:MAG: hypothetical protein ACOC44_05975 [Promethearchaeia archaeon]